MIPTHPYFGRELYSKAKKQTVSERRPFVLVTDHKRSFLNLSCHYALKTHQVPHLTKNLAHEHHHHKLAEYSQPSEDVFFSPPAICFADILLSENELMDFLCDVCLPSECAEVEYIQRKNSIKDEYAIWKTIFEWENSAVKSIEKLKAINASSEQDYHNVLMEQFNTLLAQGVGKVLSRKYSSFNKEKLSLEHALYADIILTIIKTIPNSVPDHFLRGYFHPLIEFADKVQEKINGIHHEKGKQMEVVLVRGNGFQQSVLYPNWNLNWIQFIGALTVTGFLYGYFVK